MKIDRNTDIKSIGNADMPFDANEFIRQVSGIGSKEDLPKPMPTNHQADMPLEAPEPTEEKPAKRKRIQSADYESLFLTRNELRHRQGLYIGRENYETLQTLVMAIRNERLSVSGLVDNIVSRHIELNGEEINRIYDENSRKPI